jgi:hypothetical protein
MFRGWLSCNLVWTDDESVGDCLDNSAETLAFFPGVDVEEYQKDFEMMCIPIIL